jgi:hypothetical protein
MSFSCRVLNIFKDGWKIGDIHGAILRPFLFGILNIFFYFMGKGSQE